MGDEKFITIDGLKAFLDNLNKNVETTVTEDSANVVSSGAVYTALDNLEWHGTTLEAQEAVKSGDFKEGQIVNITDDVKVIEAASYDDVRSLFGDAIAPLFAL